MPYIEIDPEDPSLVTLSTTYVEADQARQIPGSRWDKKRGVFVAPLSWGTCLTARGVYGAVLQVGPALADWATRERAVRIDPALWLRQQIDLEQDGLDPRLHPFQRAGVAFLTTAERALLGDDMGTGKTVQTIMGLRRLHDQGHEVFPALMIVPASTKWQWRDHWNEWFPGVLATIIDGTPTKKRAQLEQVRADAAAGFPAVGVINWEAVRLHSRLAPYGSIRLARCDACGGVTAKDTARCEVHHKELNAIEWRSVVCDEAHHMKDPKAKQTRAVWAVQHQPSVRFSFALTGTPIGNHPGDLWSIMHGIAPGDYPTNTEYRERYLLQAWTPFGETKIIGVRPDTMGEFYGNLDPRFRRMPKELVLPQLPSIVHERRDTTMSPKQRKSYTELSERGFTWTDDEDELIVAPNNLVRMIRQLQLASATCTLDDEGVVQLQKPSAKLDALLDDLETLEGQSIVVSAVSRKLLTLVATELEARKIEHRLIVGGMPAAQKEANRRDFQERRARVLLFTLAAGGEGLNMTTASVMIRLQRSYSLIHNLQGVARFHRIGAEQHESLTLIDYVTPGTKEVDQFRALRAKEERLEQIVRDKATLLAHGITNGQYAQLDQEEQVIMANDDLTLETI
jgi:SNF2 family DNA or RNA helicase